MSHSARRDERAAARSAASKHQSRQCLDPRLARRSSLLRSLRGEIQQREQRKHGTKAGHSDPPEPRINPTTECGPDGTSAEKRGREESVRAASLFRLERIDRALTENQVGRDRKVENDRGANNDGEGEPGSVLRETRQEEPSRRTRKGHDGTLLDKTHVGDSSGQRRRHGTRRTRQGHPRDSRLRQSELRAAQPQRSGRPEDDERPEHARVVEPAAAEQFRRGEYPSHRPPKSVRYDRPDAGRRGGSARSRTTKSN